MATAAPPERRVPVRDDERWREGDTETRSGSKSPSESLASDQSDGPTSRQLAPFLDLSRRAAFWLAVTLPVLYLPLVLAPGTFDWPVPGVGLTASSGTVVITLVALHFTAVVVGHGHARRLA